MKKIISILILLFVLLPIPIYGEEGTYNPVTGWFVCTDENSCIHEIGHRLDHEAGWVSQSLEFQVALKSYMLFQAKQKNLPSAEFEMILMAPGTLDGFGFLSNHPAEIYARLFAHSRGVSENMPELLCPYYDWGRAAELIEKVLR